MTLTIHTIETTAPVQALDPAQEPLDPPPDAAEEPAILDDILIDELSIDGMCGVY